MTYSHYEATLDREDERKSLELEIQWVVFTEGQADAIALLPPQSPSDAVYMDGYNSVVPPARPVTLCCPLIPYWDLPAPDDEF